MLGWCKNRVWHVNPRVQQTACLRWNACDPGFQQAAWAHNLCRSGLSLAPLRCGRGSPQGLCSPRGGCRTCEEDSVEDKDGVHVLGVVKWSVTYDVARWSVTVLGARHKQCAPWSLSHAVRGVNAWWQQARTSTLAKCAWEKRVRGRCTVYTPHTMHIFGIFQVKLSYQNGGVLTGLWKKSDNIFIESNGIIGTRNGSPNRSS